MQKPHRIAAQMAVSLAIVLLATAAQPLLAISTAADAGVVVRDDPAARRVVVSFGSAHGIDGQAAGGDRSPVNVPMPRATLLYRFHVVVVDAWGESVGDAVEWTLRLVDDGQTVARLSTTRSKLEIPRPYGVRLGAGDTLSILAALPEGASVRITLEYESPDDQGRLPVVAAGTAATAVDVVGASERFTWTAERSGRLVALSGASLVGAASVELVDVDAGTVIWREQASSAFGSEAQQRSEIVRLGVRVLAGRTYRLVVTHRHASDADASAIAPVAMLVPRH